MEARSWYSELVLENAAEALKKNGFLAYVAKNSDEAKSLVLSLVPSRSTVGVGGSVTVRELGLIEELERSGCKVVHHWVKADPSELDRLRRAELVSDVFLCSVNAVTLDGKLVCIDGLGNRVAAMVFGPRRVIVVAGRNKLVRDVKEGVWRARNMAAVMNSKRLGVNTPCVKLGHCVDCDSPERICRVLLVLERKPFNSDFHVILVNEDLGY
ncbi:MAG: lactate utilization protein [Thermofilaceae archaeon]|nr:lactate utilization protein [Thermofilaceae archaeon]MCX8180413.1 lactate utilization protein [Thermofilaceae archaeon]MDW8003390.1 lactate utilization protein [Thermofilaceae archaeon]